MSDHGLTSVGYSVITKFKTYSQEYSSLPKLENLFRFAEKTHIFYSSTLIIKTQSSGGLRRHSDLVRVHE